MRRWPGWGAAGGRSPRARRPTPRRAAAADGGTARPECRAGSSATCAPASPRRWTWRRSRRCGRRRCRRVANLLGRSNPTFVERATFLGGTGIRRVPRPSGPHRSTAWPTWSRATGRRPSERTPCPTAVRPRRTASRAGGPSVRRARTHLVEETGRHAGYADIHRELGDGATGH
ncbi:DUF664 domain-containing protein [Amycolatopsis sp. NPDC023774]|uniref:mycothiol transferase n=1 Tax=Amycolatopsis sp. NPDC023774 TaxID=3155015 RepID=UPI00340CD71A